MCYSVYIVRKECCLCMKLRVSAGRWTILGSYRCFKYADFHNLSAETLTDVDERIYLTILNITSRDSKWIKAGSGLRTQVNLFRFDEALHNIDEQQPSVARFANTNTSAGPLAPIACPNTGDCAKSDRAREPEPESDQVF